MNLSLKETRLGLRNSTTRLPFRYGNTCLTRCPQAVLRVVIETENGRNVGYSGDCLPPSWFDKSPDKSYQQQIDDMLATIAFSEKVFQEELSQPVTFFPAWCAANERIHQWAKERDLPALLASFGASLVERAMIDALARAAKVSFHELVHQNLLQVDPGHIHPELAGHTLSDWLPEQPNQSIFVRHSVGLSDPLTAADIMPEELLNDGYPQTLEEYLAQTGIRYLKIKVSNQLDHDVDRLLEIATLVEKYRGQDYCITLDGNEQYLQAEQFDTLMETLRSKPELETLLANTFVVEQPLARSIALEVEHTEGIRQLSKTIPVIIDESDGTEDAYVRAIELGYRGVSSKNCKGPLRSLLNAGLTWLHNDRGQRNDYVMTGEDLCTVGVVPVQADLCLVATLGLKHLERNGHHFQPGLSYLTTAEQQAALANHGDLYAEAHGRVSPQVVDGQIQIGSLQCVGFGFATFPEMDAMQTPTQWDYQSLGA